MSPAGERPVVPTKKSLRIWVKNNGHVKRKQRLNYVYPRTVEAAKDPFTCQDGKNKMFYLIAINLFPDSKIVKPEESDSESDATEYLETEQDEGSSTKSIIMSHPTILRRKGVKKSPAKAVAISQSDNSSATMTDFSNCAQISETNDKNLNTNENASRTVPIPRTKGRAGRKAIRRRSGKYFKVSRRNDENEGVLLNSNYTKSTVMLPPSCNKGVMKKASPSKSRQGTPLAIPSIVSSLHQIIRTCSETGLISFNLANEPRQSR